MRIVVAGPVGSRGGLQTHFRLLREFLVCEGHEVFSVGVSAQLPGTPPLEGDGLSDLSLRLPGGATTLQRCKLAVGLLRLRGLLHVFAPELLIACAVGRTYTSMASMLSPKVVKFYHEVIGDIAPGDQLRTRMSLAFGRTACQSPRLVDGVRRRVRPVPAVAVLPCFSNPVGEKLELLAAVPRLNQPVILSFFGRLAGNKGLPRMMRCFRRSRAYSRAELHIHGDGPESATLHRVKEEIDDLQRIKLLGEFGDEQDFARRIQQSNALVLLSTNGEGLPLVLLEAMSCGLPFLGTNVCGIPDAAEGNPDCMLTDSTESAICDSFGLFVDALESSRYDPKRLREFYTRHFSSGVMQEQWRQFLSEPGGAFTSVTPL